MDNAISTKNIMGSDAEFISRKIGIIAPPSYLYSACSIEISEFQDYVQIVAQEVHHETLVQIYNDRRIKTIDTDRINLKSLKTIYDPCGSIVTFVSFRGTKEGDWHPFQYVGMMNKAHQAVYEEWEKFDSILMDAEFLMSRRPINVLKGLANPQQPPMLKP